MHHHNLATQITSLETILIKSPCIAEILKQAPRLGLPNWYLGAGAIAQTVWNELHGFPPIYGIKDCDLVYFDPDTSKKAEISFQQKGKKLFKSLPLDVEIINEARVHTWYEQEFGKKITPYTSTEDAITTWPTTATSIGVRYENNNFAVYAPYGLHDLFVMIARPNKTLIPREVYEDKVKRWRLAWPKLKIINWDDNLH